MIAAHMDFPVQQKQTLESHISNLLKKIGGDSETRIALRTAFHQYQTMFDLLTLPVPPPVTIAPVVAQLPAPKIAGLLPAQTPRPDPHAEKKRREAEERERIHAEHYARQAERTRAHYARHPHLAEQRAVEMRRLGYDVTAADVVEAMCQPDWYKHLTNPHAGLHIKTHCGAILTRIPHARPQSTR